MRKIFFLLTLFLFFNTLSGQQESDTLIVAYSNGEPFLIEKDNRLIGINIWLWEKVANDLGLNYKLKKMKFSDALRALENESIDVCIDPLTITSSRSKKMEFTHSFFASNSTIAVKKTSSFKRFINFIRSFFNSNFLNGMLGLLFIISIFGFLIWIFEKTQNPNQFRSGWKGFFDGIYWSVVTMTTVGYGDKHPKSRGGKIIALVWMFSGILFISGLTASVASSLTVNRLSNSIEDISQYKDKLVGGVKESSAIDFLNNNFFKRVELFEDAILGLNEVKENKIEAFIDDEPILKYIIKQNNSFSDLEILPIKFDLQLYAFGLPKKHGDLEQKISQKILEIIESHEWEVVLNEYGLNQL